MNNNVTRGDLPLKEVDKFKENRPGRYGQDKDKSKK